MSKNGNKHAIGRSPWVFRLSSNFWQERGEFSVVMWSFLLWDLGSGFLSLVFWMAPSLHSQTVLSRPTPTLGSRVHHHAMARRVSLLFCHHNRYLLFSSPVFINSHIQNLRDLSSHSSTTFVLPSCHCFSYHCVFQPSGRLISISNLPNKS